MEEEESFCRFCLTFDDGGGFKPLSEEILKKVAGLNIAIVDATGVICRKCNADIETAWRTCNRILDAQDYFESLSEQQKAATKPAPKTSKIVYECDCYLATFKNIKSLEAHIAEHDLELDSETTETFNCFFCRKKFPSANQRRVHLSSHHAIEEKILTDLQASRLGNPQAFTFNT